MSKHRAKCPVCGWVLKFTSADNPYDVIRKGAKHLAQHEGQPSADELFDRAALAGTRAEAMPRA